jgi:hypothetical protein
MKSLFFILLTASWTVLHGQEEIKTAADAHTGVNLCGGKFYGPKVGVVPVYGKNFIYPTAEEFNYFASKGMNVFRVQFRWGNAAARPEPAT